MNPLAVVVAVVCVVMVVGELLRECGVLMVMAVILMIVGVVLGVVLGVVVVLVLGVLLLLRVRRVADLLGRESRGVRDHTARLERETWGATTRDGVARGGGDRRRGRRRMHHGHRRVRRSETGAQNRTSFADLT